MDTNWGKAKYDYYYTDYVDQDYPNKLASKDERLAAIEQEEALRVQKKLLSTIDNIHKIDTLYEDDQQDETVNIIAEIEDNNRSIEDRNKNRKKRPKSKVTFKDCPQSSEEEEEEEEEGEEEEDAKVEVEKNPNRRPINMAMRKNRGLTPYKKKDYRNPRVKHKIKYKRAMAKRRRNVREAQIEYHRYTGEAHGIKTSTIKSIKLC